MQKGSTEKLSNLELRYDTQSIKMGDDFVWPILRLKLNEQLRRKQGLKSRTFKLGLKSLFRLSTTVFYGFYDFLKIRQYEFWFFSSSDRRKKIDGNYIDRILGFSSVQNEPSVIIENPYPMGGHYPKGKIIDKAIFSQTLLFGLTKIIGFFGTSSIQIDNRALLNKILKDSGIELEYDKLLKNYRAQHRFMKLLLRFAKPKAVFFVYAASSMGYIKALKEKGVPVIEIQHGVINSSHNAYNINKNYGNILFPDFLLVFGNTEKQLFGLDNFFIDRENVFPIGYFFLDRILNSPANSAYEEKLRKKYKLIVVFSLQDPFEDFVFDFLYKAAQIDNEICFILVPRDVRKPYAHVPRVPNLIIERQLNVYDCLKIANIHSTINSTCAIEALCFGVPNVLYDHKGWAFDYYGSLLGDTGLTQYVETADEYVEKLTSGSFYNSKKIKERSKHFFEHNFPQNLKQFLNEKIVSDRNEE